ncbi:hypothetical protein ACRDNQ_07220 [Palleronia sp. KMU-117]|uniref:hypothetical protein n=1 Tax=Palleronia sp. KMU-117 TaxID=3434108 RepID=UPI003D72ECEC
MGRLRLLATSTALTHPGFQGAATPDIPLGWGKGEFYTLEVDPTNGARMIVEPGETTQVWYFAADSVDGYTRAEIAAVEGVSAATITASWLNGASNAAGWGKRSDLPLAWAVAGSSDIGATLFSNRFSRSNTAVRSLWALFKRGGSFPTGLIGNMAESESPLHPTLLGDFDSGSRPQMTATGVRTGNSAIDPRNVVLQGLDFCAQQTWTTDAQFITYADCNFTVPGYGLSTDIGPVKHLTLFGCSFIDCVKTFPDNGVIWAPPTGNSPDYQAGADRHSAHFLSDTDHVLRWRNFYDRNSWSPTYNTDGTTWNSGEFGPAPSYLNHDEYDGSSGLQDVANLECINTRACFDPGQWRCGTFANLLIRADNNMADLIGNGGQPEPDHGNISYFNRVAVMGRARKVTSIAGAAGSIDGKNFISGPSNGGSLATCKNVVAANLIDPNNLAHETNLADPRWTKTPWAGGVTLDPKYANPTVEMPNIWKLESTVINWGGNDLNAAGISAANKNALTLGRWADAKQGVAAGTNTTDDACDYLRTLSDRCLQAIPIWNYVAGLTGKGTIGHTAGVSATFSPDPDGDGWRTDTPDSWLINGTRGDYPVDGDDCDLNGNLAYSFMTWRFADLDFGNGGGFRLYGGYISCTSMQETSEGSVELLGAAQFWIKGASTADVVVTATGGRLGIGAAVSNVRGAFSGKSELLIDSGGSLTISTGDTLTLTGGDLKAGFDGQSGTATLTVNGTLAFAPVSGVLPQVREFRSGKYGLEDLGAGVTGQPKATSVTSTVVLASGSTITVDTTGLSAGTYDLIDVDSLTDNGATLPSGVAVVGNRLRVTVP